MNHDPEEDPRQELVDGLRAYLDLLQITGADGLPSPPVADAVAVEAQESLASEGGGGPAGIAVDSGRLDAIRADLGECTRCKLHQGRNKIVFGQGSPSADLVFVGEGPGQEEDRQGLAFVGKAGELLTKMIGAMGYTRDDVYICNIVKCRPPRNRDPELDEVEACEPFLKAQLATIQPSVIVALGRIAAQTLLGVSTPISRLRGTFTSYEGIPLMPTFHPAYLLRNASGKRAAWDDLKQVMRRLGREPRDQGH